jgi:hypothetical protein
MKNARNPSRRGRRPTPENNLLVRYPAIAAEWHTDGANGDVTPAKILPYSTFVAAWRCADCGHEYSAPVVKRTHKRQGCPRAKVLARLENSLAVKYPDLTAQWDDPNPDLRPETTPYSSNRKVWWKCAKGHRWDESPNKRTAQSRNKDGVGGCPFCRNFRVSLTNSLSACRPDLAAELDPTLNGGMTADELPAGTTTLVWWRCSEVPTHVWPARVFDRTSQQGNCPFCIGHRLAEERTFAAVRPDLVKEFVVERNGDLRPDRVAASSDQSAWWKCDEGPDHFWRANFADRARGRGCPCCSGAQVSVTNCLLTLHPEIAKLWHPQKNALTPEQVTAQSGSKVWWQCDRHASHYWDATPKSLVAGTGCPHCLRVGLSRAQHRVAWELRFCFPDLQDGRIRLRVQRVPVADSKRRRGYREVDILLPSLQVAVEMDGVYWHRAKVDDDRRKTAELKAYGLRVLRLREDGLPVLGDDDVRIGVDAGNKAPYGVASLVVRKLLTWGCEVPRAHEYLALGKPIHAVEAERTWAEKARDRKEIGEVSCGGGGEARHAAQTQIHLLPRESDHLS